MRIFTAGIYKVWFILCVFFFVQLEKLVAIDPSYVACSQQPKDSGNLTISFPFYIQDKQNSSCGYPGFGLNCNKDGNPTINITDNEYVIDRIDYRDQTIWVHIAAMVNTNFICDHQQQLWNFTLSIPNTEFDYVDDDAKLYLLLNCTNSTVQRLKDNKVACGNEYKQVFELAMLGSDENLKYALKRCSENVVVPVEADGSSGGIVDYAGLLRKGFAMKWKAADCTVCEESRGRCGFDDTSSRYSFSCFCRDRPHRGSCLVKNNQDQGVLISEGDQDQA